MVNARHASARTSTSASSVDGRRAAAAARAPRRHPRCSRALPRATPRAGSPARTTPTLSAAARRPSCAHAWPGNVRELKNIIERATYLATHGVIEPADLLLHRTAAARPRRARQPRPTAPPATSSALFDLPFKEAKQALLDDFETRYFTHLLEAHDGNLSRASAAAGITRYYLRELLKRLGLHRVKEDEP